MVSQINSTLQPETTGPNAGKIPVSRLRDQLAIAAAEITALQANGDGNAAAAIAAIETEIDNIEALLLSDNTDLDSMQELVDAILSLQTNIAGLSNFDFDADHTFTGKSEFTKSTFTGWHPQAFATTYQPDGDYDSVHTVLTGNIDLDDVANKKATSKRQTILLALEQDATGGRLLSVNSANIDLDDDFLPILSTAPNAVDLLLLTQVPSGKFLLTIFALNVG